MATRILVVDDEPAMCSFLQQTLEHAGYHVVAATHVAQVRALMEIDSRFDLAVVMPVMQGDEVARMLRQRHPDLKILFVTGYSERLFEARPILWQDEAFLDKPLTVDGLLEAVSLMLYGQIRPATRG